MGSIMEVPSVADIVHHLDPRQILPSATAPTALDTPLSMSPDSKEEGHRLPIRPRAEEQPLEQTAAHADILLAESTTLGDILEKNREGYRPIFVDHANPISLAHVVAVSK